MDDNWTWIMSIIQFSFDSNIDAIIIYPQSHDDFMTGHEFISGALISIGLTKYLLLNILLHLHVLEKYHDYIN